MTKGKLNIYSADDHKPRVIDNIEMVAGNLHPDGGLGAEIGMTGTVLGGGSPDFSFSGQVFYDPVRREFSARGLNAYLAGSRFSLDVSMNFGVTPYSFDAHLATPSLTRETIETSFGKSPIGFS